MNVLNCDDGRSSALDLPGNYEKIMRNLQEIVKHSKNAGDLTDHGINFRLANESLQSILRYSPRT